ncbi:MAG: hypothetical protein JST82_03965 [Bacteroidetes bacterium]|nr:hypothetical protein [Bacteroidota bacterium]
MRAFLRSGSVWILLIFSACTSPYKHLVKQDKSSFSALEYKPQFNKSLYRCTVNGRIIFKKFHLSGVLIFKSLENGTVRAVFQNEMGFTFFDFEWDVHDSFNVKQVIEQLNKPALIKTLKKDFNLLLMKGLNKETESFYKSSRGYDNYSCFTLDNGVAYYISSEIGLKKIENAGKRKKVLTIDINGKTSNKAMPDSVFINHHKAHFTIELHKIENHADE